MNDYSGLLRERLVSLIRQMAASPAAYVKNPEKDFTRNRKLPFETIMLLLIAMGGNSICKELLEAQGYDVGTATSSAFVQQRGKILPAAFEELFHKFTQENQGPKDYHGYRLLAEDGSALAIAADPKDLMTFWQRRPGDKACGLLHLNALYDLCNRLYLDAVIQNRKEQNEPRALTDMVERSPIRDKAILLADRGYESYNIFAHVERKGWHYLIRVKDGAGGILSGLSLPDTEEFDICVSRVLTRKQRKATKRPDLYKFMPTNQTFDFLELGSDDDYTMSFRIVRVKINDDLTETLITNLPKSEFSPAQLKELYNMRWGIETSFRKLKYTIGLLNFHAKKRECIKQEIFARLIMYNFTEMITAHVVISKTGTKHAYQVNFTVAVHVCKRFLRPWAHAPPPNVEALIAQNILPVRPNRKDARKMRGKSAISFLYRVA